jgi:hypothetical protein
MRHRILIAKYLNTHRCITKSTIVQIIFKFRLTGNGPILEEDYVKLLHSFGFKAGSRTQQKRKIIS